MNNKKQNIKKEKERIREWNLRWHEDFTFFPIKETNNKKKTFEKRKLFRHFLLQFLRFSPDFYPNQKLTCHTFLVNGINSKNFYISSKNAAYQDQIRPIFLFVFLYPTLLLWLPFISLKA